MEELGGVVKSLLREKLDEDLPRVSASDNKTELPVAIMAKGHEVIPSCEVGEVRTKEDSHPVGATVVGEVSVVRPEPPGLEESKTTCFKTVIDVPEHMQEACAEEGVHEAFKEAVKACKVHWAPETRQLAIVSAREDTSNRVAVLKEMHLKCLHAKQLVRRSNVKAARRLKFAREAMDRRGLRKDVVPVPKALIGRIIGRSGKVLQDLVNISGVVRVRIPPDNEDPISSEVGRIPIIVVGSMESLRDFRMLVKYRMGYLQEIEQLRLDHQRIIKEVRNTRWRLPPTQDVRTRRVPPSSDMAGGRRMSASGSSTGRARLSDRSSCDTLNGSDSGQTVGPIKT
ncbi:RNA-binding protein FXR1-like isoform X2 [Dendrobates tinctorius]|uniref:RNA-binding protein FXR1-like isoform X2 n=1 Tax=Dendrobates tinctorius TaxID=92724 RepID=UPI003CC96FA7